ncbi:MAG TPA: protease pro-enzyme activation domain-containing protein, partial [Bryocella sp.]|nr:protease pro-enzyme activation domain-containing protein [Bryocella sp.]
MPYNKYVKVPGSERQPMPGATQSGQLDPNEVMQITLMLRPRGGAESLAKLIASGQRISREELGSRYGADPADVQAVAAFAGHFGLAVSNVNLAARSVALNGKCSDFAKAFQVKLQRYQFQGSAYRGRTGAVNIPQELHGIVVSVHGLDNRPQAQAHFRLASPGAAAAVSYTPLQVAEAYSYPANLNGSGETIGIIELGGGYNQSDLDSFFSSLGL